MNVFQYIGELLLVHDCVIVPGFGGFIANHISSQIHPVTNNFTPPRKEILFNPGIQHNDGLLVTYISQKESISYEQALLKLNNFLSGCFNKLNNNQSIDILNVGTITYDKYNNYKFSPYSDTSLVLSSYGLEEFISPAIQRDGIEKRIEKIFSERKIVRSESKKANVFARIAMISVPAAAIFVWAFLNIGTISDISNNYSNLSSIFSVSKNRIPLAEKNILTTHEAHNSPYIWENPFIISGKKHILKQESTIVYPLITDRASLPANENTEELTLVSGNLTNCSYYIIGSCNRNVSFAENFKNKLHSNGYSNAGVLEPE
jgi:hypothetical protein